MPWNGSGSVTLTQDFVADAAAGPPASAISSTKMMDVLDDIGTMIANCLNKNGENSPTTNINWNTKKITSLGAATLPTDALQANQLSTLAPVYVGTTTGSANVHAASNVLLTSVVAGTTVRAIAGYSNSGAFTFNYNSAGNVSVKLQDGATDPPANSIVAGEYFTMTYDGTVWRLIEGKTKTFTQITVPLIIGGTAVGSAVEVRATSGVGAGAEYIKFTGGNNGATEFARLKPTGLYFPTGTIIDFNSGDVTLTHSADALALAGANAFNFGGAAYVANTTAGAVAAELRTTTGVGALDYWKVTGGNNGATEFVRFNALGMSGPTLTPGGRLTITSGSPVLSANVTAATTIYYTPYLHRYVPLWDGTRFINTDIGGELSQTLADTTKSPAATSATNLYDLFVWNDSGTIRCTRGPSWASGTGGSNTARGTGAGSTELQRTNGILNNKNAITNGPAAGYGTYVGTIYANASNQVDFIISASGTTTACRAEIGFWNMYNRVEVQATSKDTTASHTYNATAVRARNNNTSALINFVSGVAEDSLLTSLNGTANGTATARAFFGIQIDSQTTAALQTATASGQTATTSVNLMFTFAPQLGLHYVAPNEHSETAAQAVTYYDTDQYFVMAWRH